MINWAYRGKEGVDAWTGEKDYISGIRITLQDLQELIKKQEHGDTVIFLALLNERSKTTIRVRDDLGKFQYLQGFLYISKVT